VEEAVNNQLKNLAVEVLQMSRIKLRTELKRFETTPLFSLYSSLSVRTDVLLQDQQEDSFAEPHHVWPGNKRIVLFTDTKWFYIKFKARNIFFLE
jgi:hypothetical protein